jgi:RNA-directed DNA polymerase
MELKKENSRHIETAFRKLKTKHDLLALLNYCKPLIYGKSAYTISLAQLSYHANPNLGKDRYHKFSISKKDGSERTIHAPESGLKCIQRCLNLVFQVIHKPSDHAHGFVPGKSILTNALTHTNKNYVYNIDLKDFFASIDQARVWGRLKGKPFNLDKSTGRLELANIIASLCCHEAEVERMDEEKNWTILKKNVLPQGAPTSPTLTNIICQQLDFYLQAAAKRFKVDYSRYADDITFSSNHNVYHQNGEFINEIERIITAQGFHIKQSKTRLQTQEYRQVVTGLTVNKKPNLPRGYKKEIRMWLYFWNLYGLDRCNEIFVKDFLEKEHLDNTNALQIQTILKGKINFLKMVSGEDDKTYKTLSEKYNSLSKAEKNELETSNEKQQEHLVPMPKKNVVPLPIIHRPKLLTEILKMFTIDNSVLKFATHTWDAGKDESKFDGYDDFIRKAKMEFDRFNFILQELRPQLRAKILSFLFNKEVRQNGWGLLRIKFGWSSPELGEYIRSNPDKKPEDMPLPPDVQFVHKAYGGTQTIQYFSQIIDIFKNEIEIRDNNSALANILLEYHDHYLPGFRITSFENMENKSFYTDVDYLHKVFKVVFDSISTRKKTSEANSVSYVLEEEKDHYTLKVTHNNSFCRGLSKDDEKFSLTRGDFATIKTNLFNLCDWSIETQFQQGCFRINFLGSDPQLARDQKVNSCPGFTHIFRFYK